MKHKNTLKYFLYWLEAMVLVLCFCVGVVFFGEVNFWVATLLIFGPFVYGYIVGFNKHVNFIEAFERTLSAKLK